jgi:hypothetical protein
MKINKKIVSAGLIAASLFTACSVQGAVADPNRMDPVLGLVGRGNYNKFVSWVSDETADNATLSLLRKVLGKNAGENLDRYGIVIKRGVSAVGEALKGILPTLLGKGMSDKLAGKSSYEMFEILFDEDGNLNAMSAVCTRTQAGNCSASERDAVAGKLESWSAILDEILFALPPRPMPTVLRGSDPASMEGAIWLLMGLQSFVGIWGF